MDKEFLEQMNIQMTIYHVSSSSCLAAWDGKIKNGSEYTTKGHMFMP